MRLPLIFFSTLICAQHAQASVPALTTPLSRNAPWEINYDTQACRLIGSFGDKANPVITRFTRSQHMDGFALALYGMPFASPARDVQLTLDFGTGSGPVKAKAMAGNAGSLPVMLTSGSFAMVEGKPVQLSDEEVRDAASTPPIIGVGPDREARITQLTVGFPNGSSIALELGPMDKPMAAMRKCVDDLIKSWGYDPGVVSSLRRLPYPIQAPSKWFSPADYPKLELIRGQSGVVKFRVDVSAEGKVLGCTVLDTTVGKGFGDRTCEIIKRRGRFEPAQDAKGNPVATYWTSSIMWNS